jgi:hypothetical protein
MGVARCLQAKGSVVLVVEMVTAIRPPAGYEHARYAFSFAHMGATEELPVCGGHLLRRVIPGSSHEDLMGCYPLFCCPYWSGLGADVEALEGAVSVTLVADPFGAHSPAQLQQVFPKVVPFKDHYVTDLSRSPSTFISRRCLRNALSVSRRVNVERCKEPQEHAAEWKRLYRHLVKRHGLQGPAAFPDDCLVSQLLVPGLVMFRALTNSETVSMALWYLQGDVAYFHMSASDEQGYRMGASHALMLAAIEDLAARVSWLDLGAGPGLTADPRHGLDRFKRRWATGTRRAYLCGRILDAQAYGELVRATETSEIEYFPQYRGPESNTLFPAHGSTG